MADKLFELCKKAAGIIRSFPKSTRVRVVSHYDADGITAAAIMCKALYRAGYNFHTTLMRNPFDKGLERVSKEDNELNSFQSSLKRLLTIYMQSAYERVGNFDISLRLLSPEKVLARGYSITYLDGKSLKTIQNLKNRWLKRRQKEQTVI